MHQPSPHGNGVTVAGKGVGGTGLSVLEGSGFRAAVLIGLTIAGMAAVDSGSNGRRVSFSGRQPTTTDEKRMGIRNDDTQFQRDNLKKFLPALPGLGSIPHPVVLHLI